MVWNAVPQDQGLLDSAEMRARFEAVQASLLGVNWVPDPGHLIWPFETGNGVAAQTAPPAYVDSAGGGHTLQRCGTGLIDTTDYGSGGFALKLNYSIGAALVRYLLSNADAWLAGRYFSMGAAVYASAASQARLYIDDSWSTKEFSAYHSGTPGWEWLTVTSQVDASSTGNLWAGMEVYSGSAYIQGATVLLGEIPPLYPIPPLVRYRTLDSFVEGTPGATSYGNRPLFPEQASLFVGMEIVANTAPSAGTLVANFRKYDGSVWVPMLNADVTLTSGNNRVGSKLVTTQYADRCTYHGYISGTPQGFDNVMRPYVLSNAGSAADIRFFPKFMMPIRPYHYYGLAEDPEQGF